MAANQALESDNQKKTFRIPFFGGCTSLTLLTSTSTNPPAARKANEKGKSFQRAKNLRQTATDPLRKEMRPLKLVMAGESKISPHSIRRNDPGTRNSQLR